MPFINTLKPEQNSHHFADNFIYLFLKGNFYILIEIALKWMDWILTGVTSDVSVPSLTHLVVAF